MSDVTADRRGGILNIVDVIVSPTTAFQRLRSVPPAWVWAFVAATLLTIAGSLLTAPAATHAINTGLPAQLAANPAIARLPAERAQAVVRQQVAMFRTITQISWLFAPFIILITGLIQAVVMSVANAIGRGDGTFAKFFALSQTVAVIGTGLNALVLGIIISLRGADSFDDVRTMAAVMPSLAMVAPGAHGALLGFLEGFSIFTIWATVLLALGMTIVARIPRNVAWITAGVMIVAAAGFTAFGAAQRG